MTVGLYLVNAKELSDAARSGLNFSKSKGLERLTIWVKSPLAS